MTTLTQADLDALKQYDTPTICNALEIVAPERRTLGFTHKPLSCLDPSLPPMVGYARTATIRAREAPRLAAEEMRKRRGDYYEYVAKGGATPSVIVIQDLDPEPGFGAFWGEVNTNVHKSLGALGCVTNGSFRDIDACAPGFQLLGVIGPSHAHVHVVSYGGHVNIHGMGVNDGDLIHADRHGAVIVPHDVVTKIPATADLLGRREAVILDACKAPDFDIDKLKAAMEGSAEIH